MIIRRGSESSNRTVCRSITGFQKNIRPNRNYVEDALPLME